MGHDLATRGSGIIRKQFFSLHNLTRLAIATLRDLLGNPCALQGNLATGRKTLNGCHLLTGHTGHWY